MFEANNKTINDKKEKQLSRFVKAFIKGIVPTALWETIRSIRIKHDLQAFEKHVVSHCYGGQERKVLIADALAKGWYDHDWPRLQEIEILNQSKLVCGATAFDLGAHQGVVAMMLANEVGQAGKVIAVEGMQHNCEVARENARLNDVRNLEVIHAVVAQKKGKLRFFDGLNGTISKSGVGSIVDAVTIDELSEKYGFPDVVFLDIEGHESVALKGALKTIERGCDWFVEVHVSCGLEVNGGTVDDIASAFDNRLYNRLIFRLEADEPAHPYVSKHSITESRFGFIALRITN